MRPRLLLIPEFTELQWTIKPLLEQWAEVRSFDPPGVGAEPSPEELSRLTRDAVVDRAIQELDQAGWESFFLAADGWSTSVAVRLAEQRPEAVLGLALGHASLSNRREGERAPINAEVYAAMEQLIENDAPSFIRFGIVQSTAGSIDEEVAEQMMSRLPAEDMVLGWKLVTADDPFEESLRSLRCPMLLAKHQGCLMSTDEGFDDAVAALPNAETVIVPKAPCTSPEFAEALRGFCRRVGAEAARI
jgi:pimeloyl-ACP methyl ester carboxylesterase